MTTWTPIAILPNLYAKTALDGDVIALVLSNDPRVVVFCKTNPKFALFLSRFRNAFDLSLSPVVMLARDDVTSKLVHTDAYQSFRDIAACSVIPFARALSVVYPNSSHIWYSDSFWLYPYTYNAQTEYLSLSTPALGAINVVDNFHGQSMPELPEMELTDIDFPLFNALLKRWAKVYLEGRQTWKDRALFRSLNMAFSASQLPSGAGTILYDVGRCVGLWVSAFEILAHPKTEKSDITKIYPLLEKVSYIDPKIKQRRYAPYTARVSRPWPRRNLPCWLYSKLYQARNDFLHGNPIKKNVLNPKQAKAGLFVAGPLLFRLALTSFLNLKPEQPQGKRFQINSQHMIERALLRTRK
ncbi:hypothetical protein [Paludibacterium sp.]|uniref:hypothetical protein n=1 Tax=Paludibacterium sp. TaxID=1917523 RepID=UPI0025F4A8C1|nr:hypothetical protein [Paludibacterium sp.]MBV8648461.1 hypothetical protein [Paludibacterium sp.]